MESSNSTLKISFGFLLLTGIMTKLFDFWIGLIIFLIFLQFLYSRNLNKSIEKNIREIRKLSQRINDKEAEIKGLKMLTISLIPKPSKDPTPEIKSNVEESLPQTSEKMEKVLPTSLGAKTVAESNQKNSWMIGIPKAPEFNQLQYISNKTKRTHQIETFLKGELSKSRMLSVALIKEIENTNSKQFLGTLGNSAINTIKTCNKLILGIPLEKPREGSYLIEWGSRYLHEVTPIMLKIVSGFWKNVSRNKIDTFSLADKRKLNQFFLDSMNTCLILDKIQKNTPDFDLVLNKQNIEFNIIELSKNLSKTKAMSLLTNDIGNITPSESKIIFEKIIEKYELDIDLIQDTSEYFSALTGITHYSQQELFKKYHEMVKDKPKTPILWYLKNIR